MMQHDILPMMQWRLLGVHRQNITCKVSQVPSRWFGSQVRTEPLEPAWGYADRKALFSYCFIWYIHTIPMFQNQPTIPRTYIRLVIWWECAFEFPWLQKPRISCVKSFLTWLLFKPLNAFPQGKCFRNADHECTSEAVPRASSDKWFHEFFLFSGIPDDHPLAGFQILPEATTHIRLFSNETMFWHESIAV